MGTCFFTESCDKQMAGKALVKADVAEHLSKACFMRSSPLQKSVNSADLNVL